MTNMEGSCECCVFYKTTDNDGDGGICRRYPPKPCVGNEKFRSDYPVVYKHDFCGEFKPQSVPKEQRPWGIGR